MSAIDLKPLTKEIIHKMGYSTHDLWIVKINDDVYGPFEVESLKHYASENEHQFAHAFVSRLESPDWQPFFSLAIFASARKNDKAKAPSDQEGPFWLLSNGQKVGPMSRMDVEKKIEMGILGLNELISFDDGHTWCKIYLLPAFAERTLNAEVLPDTPHESSFLNARENLLEKIKSNEENPSAQQNIANLMYLGTKKDGTRLINLDEIDLKTVKETEVSRSLKWMIPAMSGAFAIFLVTAYMLFKRPDPTSVAQVEEEEIEVRKPKFAKKTPSENYRPARPNRMREPASVPAFDRSEVTRKASVHREEARFPEPQIDTHEAERFPQNEPDPMNDPVAEAEPQNQDGQEPSLVKDQNREPAQNNDQPIENGETLDGAMDAATTNAANEEAPVEPVIQENSDF